MTPTLTQAEVNYRQGDQERCCGNCVMFHAPSTCDLVEGPVEAHGVCDRWEAATGTPAAARMTANEGQARGGTMTTRTRDEILADWHAVIAGPGLGLVASDSPVAFAALQASYDQQATWLRMATGAEPYWLTEGSPFISQEERDKAAKSGAAMPDGSYPITTCDGENSVSTAVKAVGRGGADHDAIRAHIMKRADSLGCASLIPENWNSDGSLKAGAEAESFAPPPPPPPPAHPAPPGAAPAPADGKTPPAAPKPEAGDDDESDAAVTAKVESALAAVQDAIAEQQKDPDAEKDPKDAKVLADLQHAEAALKQAQTDQEADAAETKGGAAPAAPAAHQPPPAPPQASGAAPVTAAGPAGPTAPGESPPGSQEGVPGDADDSPPGPGDIEATIPCDNPTCGHFASAHEDTAEGKNTGACTMEGCMCAGMVPSGEFVNAPGPEAAPPATAQDEEQAGAPTISLAEALEMNRRAAFAPVPDELAGPPGAPPEPQAPAMEGAPTSELPPLDPMPSAVVGPAFTIPVAWLEGVPTGDGRVVNADVLTWRTPPLPLMFLKTSPHDPSGMSPNDPAVLAGRIEEISRDGNKGVAKGHLLSTPEGEECATILEQMGRMGVSIDVGSAQTTVTPDPTAPPGNDVFDVPLVEQLTKGEIMGITVCPFAAFAGAYIVLGDGSNVPEAEVPAPPAGAKLAWREVAAETCVPCEGANALVASGAPSTATGGPLAPPRAWFEDPAFGASPADDVRLVETIDSKTGRPSGKFACPLTVTEDGRVFGHIAQWGVCHQSPKFLNNGQCILAPRSKTGYALFHSGHVLTAEGEVLAVGKLTAEAAHASEDPRMTAEQVDAHYANSAMTVALVAAGEDEHGIWVAGSVHPAASPEQVFTLRANPPSGDWRPFGAGNELRQVLMVNTPGFPVVRARFDQGKITSLVAAGVPMFELPEGTIAPPEPPTVDDRLDALEGTVTALAPYAAARLRDEMATLRGG